MKPKSVLYCGVCGFPAEFCEFRADFEKCKPWIRANCPELYPPGTLGGESDVVEESKLEEGVEAISLNEGESKKEKKQKKVKSKSVKVEKPDTEAKVVFTLTNRNKRKFVTIVSGLETCDIKLKDAAKVFGKRFSCGSSVSENAAGFKEIHIQGDVTYDLPDVLENTFKIPIEKIFISEKGVEKPLI